MRNPIHTKNFRKDYSKLEKSGNKNMDKLNKVLDLLIDGKYLDFKYKDHPLHGEFEGYRDCHIEGDWVLIYKIEQNKNGNEIIIFHATDNHSNLFR